MEITDTHEYYNVLNKLFTETYNNIGKYEENTLKNSASENLSLGEYHMIECIGSGESENGRTIGDIAQYMDVTLPTVTVAINKLEKKGYVTKHKSAFDGRVVYIRLTRQGKKMDAAHRYFHKHMVRIVGHQFNDGELEILIKCMSIINDMFKTMGDSDK
jgi:Transcriptional regulators